MNNNVLELESLTMIFGGLKAVSSFDLAVEQGQLIGLIGPNGAGKTTVFNMITQHYVPTKGEVIYYGKNVNGMRPDKAVELGIARTFQNIRLFSGLSVLDNVLAGMHLRLNSNLFSCMLSMGSMREKEKRMEEKAWELLEVVGLQDYGNEIASSLAYGLQRRLEMARAMATEPRLLLLDEPAAGMNPQEIVDLMDLIREIRDKFQLTILVIEHHMDLVMALCERIAVLNYGVKIAEGTAEEVQNDPRVIEAYLGVSDSA